MIDQQYLATTPAQPALPKNKATEKEEGERYRRVSRETNRDDQGIVSL